jgi:hypothetical protein
VRTVRRSKSAGVELVVKRLYRSAAAHPRYDDTAVTHDMRLLGTQ